MKSIRNNADMSCIAMPEKFRRLGDFANYYNGKKVAPVLTIFIGGNHEASNYLRELYFFFSKGNRLIKGFMAAGSLRIYITLVLLAALISAE
jgi:hypothetical protein